MATPADQRLLELLDKWLESLELHAKYSSLDNDSYWKVQPWVEHQRPTRWILDLAKQKITSLRNQVTERMAMADAQFSDSLELMAFLANLMGSQHIERFIPLAAAQNERSLTSEAVEDPPAARASDAARDQVIADAVRLVQWGRKWYELPELVARMADRPPLPEVRRILKENRAAIDQKASGAHGS
ncbi:MAG: hypothetical protein M3N50_03480 [Pseudomonadota bacterium]|nr:hypothetical protein [Pseudomonadota bacterium]